MFSAARPAFDGATRRVNGPSTSWLRSSFSAIARACSSAMRSSVASRITRPSPFLSRNAEICAAGEASSACAAGTAINMIAATTSARSPCDMKRRTAILRDHLDRIDVDGRLFIGMCGADRREHRLQPVLRADRLDPLLFNNLDPADAADRGIGAGERPEAPDARHGKRTVIVIANPPGAGLAHGTTHGLTGGCGNVDDDLVEIGRASCRE